MTIRHCFGLNSLGTKKRFFLDQGKKYSKNPVTSDIMKDGIFLIDITNGMGIL
jgi:hypothetical protein